MEAQNSSVRIQNERADQERENAGGDALEARACYSNYLEERKTETMPSS